MAKVAKKLNEYEEYRHNLVVERKTTWSDSITVTNAERAKITAMLHADPQSATQMDYIRCPTGLIQHITVTQKDVDRIFDMEAS